MSVTDRVRPNPTQLPKGFPTLDPEAVARAGSAHNQAVASTSQSRQNLLYQQALNRQRAQLEANIAASRARATVPTSVTPAPTRSGGGPQVRIPQTPQLNPQNLTRAVAPVARTVNRVLPFVAAGLDVASGLEAGEDLAESLFEAGSALAGSFAGAGAGAGAAVTAVAPIAAALPPAAPFIVAGAGILGGVGGSLFGWGLGGTAADRLYDYLFPNPAVPNPAVPPGTVVNPPFYGGQLNGIMYSVRVDAINMGSFAAGPFQQIMGPIVFAGIYTPKVVDRYDDYGQPIYAYRAYAAAINAAGEVLVFSGNSGGFTESEAKATMSYVRSYINRADGQPDTGGNPAPLPGTPSLTIAPATGSPVPLTRPSPVPTGAPPGVPDPLAPNPRTVNPSTPAPATNPRPGGDEPDPADPSAPSLPQLPPWLPLIAIPAFGNGGRGGAGGGGGTASPSGTRVRRSSSNRQPQPSQSTSGSTQPPTTQPPTLTCRYDSANIKGEVVQANTTLTAINSVLETVVISKLNTIDTKLGPQIPGGGISGMLGKVFGFARKTWDFLQVGRILNVLTWIAVLHNAYMLSNSLSQTLFSAISAALDATGLDEFLGLVNSDDEEVNVGELVGKITEDFFKTIFGVEAVDGFKSAWKKYNRIYQAAANILNSVQSMVYSMVNILETISNYAGRIGNALQRSGTILQNSFNWMNTNVNYNDSRFFRFLQRTQDAVELVEQIASEVVSIQDMGEELFNQSEEFNTAMRNLEGEEGARENEARGAQKKPNTIITPADERPSDGND